LRAEEGEAEMSGRAAGAPAAARLVVALCLAEVAGMMGFACFAAVLPTLAAEWRLSALAAGWIGGVYFAGYTVAVPVLVSLTDRIDPRRVYLASTVLAGAASLLFGLLAHGFWTALLAQALAGMGLAGTYMPGLKALTDRLSGGAQSRAVAFYTSSFGIGASLSFLVAGQVAASWGWRAAFLVASLGSAAACAIAASVLAPRPPAAAARRSALLDFRPVLRNRALLARMLAYSAHNFELFGVRSWIVAYLVFAASRSGGGAIDATVVAAAMTLMGLPGSVLGNEAAMRWGRIRVICAVMACSIALSCAIGFLSFLPMPALAALCLLYGAAIAGESSALTASLVAEADPALRGTTMGLYSTVGFVGAFLGPLLFGAVLDGVGRDAAAGWGLAFATLGAGCAVGPAALLLLGRAARRRGAEPS
jgi:MFS family permease